MRIVHLILTSHFAGSERHAIELANAQAAQHDVTLVLRRAAAKSRAGGYAHRVDSRVKVVLVGDWFARWHARKVLRRLRPEVAHAHLSVACKALQGLKGLCLRLATLHICYKPQQHAGLDALVAIAPWQMEAIPQSLRDHTIQVDNWTLPHPPDADARQRLRELHGIAQDAWVFGAIGRAERSKGFDLLIEAFQRAALPNAHLVIVGHGDQLEALRRKAGKNVHLPGFSEHPQDWLAAFDCFVSAARDEPFGLVLLEAMESGLPILASATQGARHLNEVMASPLIPLGDVDALAAGLREQMRQRPSRRIYPMERFRIEGKLVELERFYRRELACLATGSPT
jgi:glycosyltransferase involved in cell wall biosynthesis